MVGKMFKGLIDELLCWQIVEFFVYEMYCMVFIVFFCFEFVVEIVIDGVQWLLWYFGGIVLWFVCVKGYCFDKLLVEVDMIQILCVLLCG